MTTKLKVTIADQDGMVLDQEEVDIVALDTAIRVAFEERGEVMAARTLNRAGSEVEDALLHEIKNAWQRYCKSVGKTTVLG
jgi:hypothetical protein